MGFYEDKALDLQYEVNTLKQELRYVLQENVDLKAKLYGSGCRADDCRCIASSKRSLVVRTWINDNLVPMYQVVCESCGTRTDWFQTRGEAEDYWNRNFGVYQRRYTSFKEVE